MPREREPVNMRALAPKFDPADVSVSTDIGRIGRSKARISRAASPSWLNLTLTHLPTGVQVTGRIPEGHYTRQSLAHLRDELQSSLLQELEPKAIRALKV